MEEKQLEIVLTKLEKQYDVSVVTVNQIIKEDFGPELWTIEKLIPQQSITAITGMPGSFKTWLTLEIAKCVSQGSDFLGKFKTSKGNVLFIDKENHLRHIQKRLKMLGVENLPIFYFLNPEDFFLNKEEDYKSVIRAIGHLGIDLVIFDSLVRIHNGDENEAQHIAKVMGAFRKITNKGATVIFIHHNRKEGTRTQSTTNSIRGSSDIFAGIDCLLQISKPPKENYLGINQAKLRQDEAIEPFRVEICSDKEKNLMTFTYGGDFDSNAPEIKEAKESTLAILQEEKEVSRPQFIEMLSEDYSIPVIDGALKEVIKSELVKMRKGQSGKNFYSLNTPI